jgi:hypothetical protein
MTEGLKTGAALMAPATPLMASIMVPVFESLFFRTLTQWMVVSFAMPKALPPAMEARLVPSGREKCVSCLCGPASSQRSGEGCRILISFRKR